MTIPKYRLYAAVFIAGAVVMAFEMAGSRVMAPAVGTSIIAWTALIGVILASLSFGYFWGGRVADRDPRPQRLAMMLANSSLAIAATSALAWAVTMDVASVFVDIRIAAVMAAGILFAPAAVLLGTVTPLAAKMAIRDLATDGRTVGTLAAVSTAGSIAGTFLGGFVLIPFAGVTATFAILAVMSAAAALLVWPAPGAAAIIIAAGIVFAAGRAPSGAIVEDTAYQRLLIVDAVDPRTGRPMRYLLTNPHGAQAAQFRDSDELVFPYTRSFGLAERIAPVAEHSLTIGGAAYTWPRDFLARNPSSRMTVVELDPGMTHAARAYFRFAGEPRMDIVHEDGRVFLNRNRRTFGAVYLDAYSDMVIPFQLVTREAFTALRRTLDERGVLMANLVGSLSGPHSPLIDSIAATAASVFPYVALIPLNDDASVAGNVMLVASNFPPDWPDDVRVFDGRTRQGVVLTDDRAPVEFLSLALSGTR